MIGSSDDVVSEYSGASHEARPKTDSEEIGERWGTGEAEITSVQLMDGHQEIVSSFDTNRPAIVRISYTSRIPVEEPVFGVRITHLHGTVVWGNNTKRSETFIPTISGDGHIDLRIDSLPLLEGTYDLTIVLTDMSGIHEYDHWERKIRFDVRQLDSFDEGLALIPARWVTNI
jgi:hypothetical protein